MNQNLPFMIAFISIAALFANVLAIQYTYALSVTDYCSSSHENTASLGGETGMQGNYTTPSNFGMQGNYTTPSNFGMQGNYTTPSNESVNVNIMAIASGSTLVNITLTDDESSCTILATLPPQ